MTTTIDPRIRERRIEVQREAGRKRLRITLLVVVRPGRRARARRTSPSITVLDVDHVRIEGVQTLDPAAVERGRRASRRGAPLLRVDTGAVAARIERLPWVADAEVSTRSCRARCASPCTNVPPVAYVRRDDAHVAVLDADGHRDRRQSPRRSPGLVEVRGAASVPAAGGALEPAGAAGVVRPRCRPSSAARVACGRPRPTTR